MLNWVPVWLRLMKADKQRAAVMVAKIATGEIAERIEPKKESAAAELGREGGEARAASLTKKKRVEMARKAAAARLTGVRPHPFIDALRSLGATPDRHGFLSSPKRSVEDESRFFGLAHLLEEA